MPEKEIVVQAAIDSAKWAYYAIWVYGISAVIAALSAIITLYAVFIAKKGLISWKEQHISTAKAEWIASLVSYNSGLSFLPHHINWMVDRDSKYVNRIAELQYECIKRWKVLQVHLEQSPKIESEFRRKYNLKWAAFSLDNHNAYMNGQISKLVLSDCCIELYNT